MTDRPGQGFSGQVIRCWPQSTGQNDQVCLVKGLPDRDLDMLDMVSDGLMAFHGHFSVMIKAYSYILSMGSEGLEKVSHLAVLNANYIKEQLKGAYHLPFDKTCMHECVFTDKHQNTHKVSTLDIAKRLMDYGFHPPTIYFPLVVAGAIMVEPTETESAEDLDRFFEAVRSVVAEARSKPELLKSAPVKTKVRRLDETAAAREPCLAE